MPGRQASTPQNTFLVRRSLMQTCTKQKHSASLKIPQPPNEFIPRMSSAAQWLVGHAVFAAAAEARFLADAAGFSASCFRYVVAHSRLIRSALHTTTHDFTVDRAWWA